MCFGIDYNLKKNLISLTLTYRYFNTISFVKPTALLVRYTTLLISLVVRS